MNLRSVLFCTLSPISEYLSNHAQSKSGALQATGPPGGLGCPSDLIAGTGAKFTFLS